MNKSLDTPVLNSADVVRPGPWRTPSLLAMKWARTDDDLAEIRDLARDEDSVRDRTGEWLDFARRNEIEPLVAKACLEAWGGGHPAGKVWTERYAKVEAYVRVLMHELDALAERLHGDGIALIALKNAGIARGIYPHLGCCPMGDIDTLVSRDRLRDAHRLAVETGFEHASRAPTVEPADLEHSLLSGGSEYRKQVGEHTVWLEIQWRPIAGRWIPKGLEPDGQAMIERSVSVQGTKVRLLQPTDNMLQVALHTAKHSYCRAPGLRLHTDVDRLAALTPPDWNQLSEVARQLGLASAVFMSLALARAMLGSPIPDFVLAELAPARWKRELLARWLRTVDIFEPSQKKFNRPAMLAFHSLLYDDLPTLGMSVAGTTRKRVSLRDLPTHVRAGASRLLDVVSRYER